MRIKVSFYRLRFKILNLLFFLNIIVVAGVFAQPSIKFGFNKNPKLIVLGTVQDGGCPHIGCRKSCCQKTDSTKKVVSLGLIDFNAGKKFLFEATPEIGNQLKYLQGFTPKSMGFQPDGIFLTHAHIGHYAGLMFLGKEALNSSKIPVFAMPRMKSYLEENGPWSQLVKLENIVLQPIIEQNQVEISPKLKIIPFKVPHRDEFSETVGYKIIGPHKTVLFIPDIDKWSKWTSNITEVLSGVDMAFIDGTFYSGVELNNRDMSTIPHPSVQETMKICETLSASEKNKVYFIHFNHTNPLLNPESLEFKEVINKGFHIAKFGEEVDL
jgi:pyrroloquinoline quinone biosynthesis protein B